MHKVLSVFVLILCLSCESRKTEVVVTYFDLPEYLAVEQKKLELKPVEVSIQWAKDEKRDSAITKKVNWKDAFAPLKKINLNKPAYQGAFQIDTSTFEEGFVITYTAKTTKVQPALLRLTYTDGNIAEVYAKVVNKNPIYESVFIYTFVPDDRLAVSGTQKVIFGKKHAFSRILNF